MSSEAILTVSAAVVALTQLAKWSGLSSKRGPIAVLILAAIGVAVWGFTQPTIGRGDAFSYFAGWVTVALSAAGVFGFTRAGAESVASVTPPPKDGAGSSPVAR